MHHWKCQRVLRPLLMAVLAVSLEARPGTRSEMTATATAIGTWLRQDRDFAQSPALREFVLGLVAFAPQTLRDTDPELARLLRDLRILEGPAGLCLQLTREDTGRFLRACAQDRLTMLRAISLIARVVRRGSITLVVGGTDLTSGLRDQRLSDGLSIPSEHALLYVYVPDPRLPEPFQCRFLALYDRPFTHAYPENPACAPVAIGAEAEVRLGARRVLASQPACPSLHRVAADLHYDATTAGLFNVRGLGIAGVKSVLGSVAAMYSKDRTLVLETSRFHVRRRIPGFEAPEHARVYAVHPQ